MKVVHISKQDSSASGSVVYNSHKILIKNGYNSIILTKFGINTKNELVFKPVLALHFENLVRKIVNKYFSFLNPKIDKNYYMHSIKESSGWISKRKIIRKAKKIGHIDWIIVYFIDNFLNFKNLQVLQEVTKAKVLFYPMDMAIMTGGCHYSWDCFEYIKNCGNCPGIYSHKIDDRTAKNIMFKRYYLNKIKHKVIAPSETLYQQLKVSSLFKNSLIKKLLIPVDHEIFLPISVVHARSYFSLPSEIKIIFFGAQGIDEKRKGFNYFVEYIDNLLNYYEKSEIFILIAGQSSVEFNKIIPFKFKHLGKIDLKLELPLAYNAADIFISTSIQDSGPMMVNQSLMCGTPVITFNIGVATDLIIDGQNGYIIKNFNCAEMALKSTQILNSEKELYLKMRSFTRQHSLSINSNQEFCSNLIEILNEG